MWCVRGVGVLDGRLVRVSERVSNKHYLSLTWTVVLYTEPHELRAMIRDAINRH